jgi:hypothetical protein
MELLETSIREGNENSRLYRTYPRSLGAHCDPSRVAYATVELDNAGTVWATTRFLASNARFVFPSKWAIQVAGSGQKPQKPYGEIVCY